MNAGILNANDAFFVGDFLFLCGMTVFWGRLF